MEFDRRISDKIDTSRQIIFTLIFAGLAREIIIRPNWLQDLTTRSSILYDLFFLTGIWVIFSSVQKIKHNRLQLGQKIIAVLASVAAIAFCGAVLVKLLLPLLSNA